jgi:hypothetical protein
VRTTESKKHQRVRVERKAQGVGREIQGTCLRRREKKKEGKKRKRKWTGNGGLTFFKIFFLNFFLSVIDSLARASKIFNLQNEHNQIDRSLAPGYRVHCAVHMRPMPL